MREVRTPKGAGSGHVRSGGEPHHDVTRTRSGCPIGEHERPPASARRGRNHKGYLGGGVKRVSWQAREGRGIAQSENWASTMSSRSSRSNGLAM